VLSTAVFRALVTACNLAFSAQLEENWNVFQRLLVSLSSPYGGIHRSKKAENKELGAAETVASLKGSSPTDQKSNPSSTTQGALIAE